ncbi:hypothetical protein Leryth_014194 [Lithospermum erythrorhizon]|nr:hypothetical protein Leryth_014194 [Lithospermum erythrorhizon]
MFNVIGTTADDLYPLFDRYGKVMDIHIPRDRRTGDSRGFAFVRYKYYDEAEKAVDRLDGRVVDGREMAVQFAKYGPNSERIHQGRVIEKVPSSRSRSPRRHRDDHYRGRDYRRRSRSRSRDSYERDRYRGRERDYRRRSRSPSYSPHSDRGRRAERYDDAYKRDRLLSASPGRTPSPIDRSPDRYVKRSPSPRNPSPRDRSVEPQSPARDDEDSGVQNKVSFLFL